MYVCSLNRGPHVRRFTITLSSSSGWEVRDELDSMVLKSWRYNDWRRVERARETFAAAAAKLRDAGWVDAQR